MLKNIPPILSPELLKILMEMGHGDEIVIADGNFPSEACGQRVVRADGHSGNEILTAIMQLFPLDSYVDRPIALMAVAEKDKGLNPEIWNEYNAIIKKYEPENCRIELVERFDFYDRAKKAYAIIATGETAIYANIILKKGVVNVNE